MSIRQFAYFCFAGILGLQSVAGLNAQEGQVSGIQILSFSESSDRDGEFPKSLSKGIAGAFAPGSSISFGSSIGGVDPGDRSQLFRLLSNDSVRRELNLTDEQFGGVQKIQQESQSRVSKMMQAKMAVAEGGSIRFSGDDFKDLMAENRATAEAAIEEILLPEQMKRVRQLAYQVEVSQEGLGEALVNGRLGTEIGIHEDQKQNLSDRAAKIEAEAVAAILKIRAEARARLFQELTPDQRKAAEERLGDYFEYKEPSVGAQIRKRIKSLRANRESASKAD